MQIHSQTHEVNFDGLIGPTHNYGGLSLGNIASKSFQGRTSFPKQAAIEGLEKMRLCVRLGLKQGVIPPHPRPETRWLKRLGMDASNPMTIPPEVFANAMSASNMWTANAATVSPSADTGDGKLHLSVANLSTMLHRSIEAPFTSMLLWAIFGVGKTNSKIVLHPSLPYHYNLSDEGAANHVRLGASHGAPSVEIFVYGRDADETLEGFPSRQSFLASESIARRHKLNADRTVFARQSLRAIANGAFHNDVVCVGTRDTLFFHEHAFQDKEKTLNAIRQAAKGLFELNPVCVPNSVVPLKDAISSYLFNSQLLEIPGQESLVLLAPSEVRDTPSAKLYCDDLISSGGPIGEVIYADVRQSMQNGGGPACLRLRVAMTQAELAQVHAPCLLDEAKIDALQAVIRETYPDRLEPDALQDKRIISQVQAATRAVFEALDLDGVLD